MGLGDAGPSDLEEPRSGPARDEPLDLEFTRAVKAEIALRDILPQESVDADDAWRSVPSRRRPVDDDKMIADAVEPAEVAAGEPDGGVGDRAALLEEDAIAEPLGAPHFLAGRREARFERAGAGQDRAESGEVALAGEALQESFAPPPPAASMRMSAPTKVPANPWPLAEEQEAWSPDGFMTLA